MRYRQGAVAPGAVQRLSVTKDTGSGSGIANVTDCDVALQLVHDLLVEDLVDESHLLKPLEALAVGDVDTRRFLSAMLEGEESEVGEPGDVLSGREDAEYSAFFLRS